ncbi:C39 family peptidase [Campylobacter avium]|uniref:C39 family peptidase n=1 Tax=Campylobacter avium TaxID=522485 RepID=UPI002354D1FB|nr:cysteine peptidase family C39 domain-containing protein [Campylobacter avium]
MEKILRIFLLFIFAPLCLKAEFVVKSYQELKNERVIRQNYEQSCGASSLATMINLIDDENLSEFDVLKLMSEQELQTDMVSFADLETVLSKLGYENKSYKINKENLDKLVNIPMIVKIEDDPRFPHFVLIINYKGDFLEVLDPSHGRYTSSKREFLRLWDRYNKGGFALLIKPKKEKKDYRLNLSKNLSFEFKTFKIY